MSLDIAAALRTALINEATIAGLLSDYQNDPAVFTRTPVPTDAKKPFIVVSPDVTITDFDGLISRRPEVVRDILIYGDQPDDFRTVEQIGYSVRELFHRKKDSIILTGFNVVDVTAVGPRAAPTSNEETVGRLVTLTILLREIP